MAWNTCCKCKSQMFIPDDLNNSALRARGVIKFYCAYGHEQYYVVGASEEEKLRHERDRLIQRLAQKDDTIKSLEGSRAALKGQVTKMKNRVGHGVCPCCTRSFSNLARHMATQHAGFAAEAAE